MNETSHPGHRTLADVRPGAHARVRALDGLETRMREQLQAYGLAPGRAVRVLQHAPLTVVRIDHTDLALEHHLAAGITVESGDAQAAPHLREDGPN